MSIKFMVETKTRLDELETELLVLKKLVHDLIAEQQISEQALCNQQISEQAQIYNLSRRPNEQEFVDITPKRRGRPPKEPTVDDAA